MTTPTRKLETDIAVYKFTTSERAWKFMRECEGMGHGAGYPALGGIPGFRHFTVQVRVETFKDRIAVDKLAAGAPVVAYAFAGQSVNADGTVAQ